MIPGLQLWSVRDQLIENTDDTLKHIANMGIETLEALDIEQTRDLQSLVASYDLRITNTFIYWAHITKRWDQYNPELYPWHAESVSYEQLAETCSELELETAVLGYIPPAERETVDDFKHITEQLNIASEVFENAGIKLAYHNHAFEFEDHNGFNFYDYLICNTDKLYFELDTFWCYVTGNHPTDLLNQLQSRCCSLHLKNPKSGFLKTFDDQIMPKEYFVPLNKGEIDMEKVLEKAKFWGVKSLFLEQDHAKNIWGELTQSINYLTTV